MGNTADMGVFSSLLPWPTHSKHSRSPRGRMSGSSEHAGMASKDVENGEANNAEENTVEEAVAGASEKKGMRASESASRHAESPGSQFKESL